MEESQRLALLLEVVTHCQRMKALGAPASVYSRTLREAVHFLWERRHGSKMQAVGYRSRKAAGIAMGKGKLIYDHAVPFKFLRNELLAISSPTKEAIRDVLARHGTVVLITREEEQVMNAARLGSAMPKDWDGVDHLARYHACGIEIDLI